MRRRLTTWLDVALTVVVFAAFVPVLMVGACVLWLHWGYSAARALAQSVVRADASGQEAA